MNYACAHTYIHMYISYARRGRIGTPPRRNTNRCGAVVLTSLSKIVKKIINK